MCSLFNLLVESKGKLGGSDEEESDMDLDSNEKAAEKDHEEAQRQLDDPEGKWTKPKGRKLRGKKQGQVGMETAEPVKNETGKRDAEQAGTEEPPPPKCLQLPPTENPEVFDMTKDDDAKSKDGANVKVPE